MEEAFLDKHYNRLRRNHRIKKNGRKPILSMFYILYPKSQNGMGKVSMFYDGGCRIEFMKNGQIHWENITLFYNIQKATVTYEENNNRYESRVWYRTIGFLGNSALTKKFGGRRSRRIK